MELPLVTVDAFTDIPFSGNPAGICLLPWSISDKAMQMIAAEVNLSETAFLETIGDQEYNLRWFTPTKEVNLCGHATLASAFLLFTEDLANKDAEILFHTKSGILIATFVNGMVQLDFPVIPTEEAEHPYFTEYFFGQKVVGAAKLARNWILELENPKAVEYVLPVWSELALHSEEGIIITSKGDDTYDIISRYFAPNIGIQEDPVTGFAHCALIDYWYKKNHSTSIKAYQASKRGGILEVELQGNRVMLRGDAVKMFEGFFTIDL
ncbi:MAG TPA: PhzF family phenazine biosynthesis isomerase [Lunatimonas sp.]|nr:PhzF family phenazine biosynthesis isomerase [Lunatimonas sp.]